MGLSAGAIFGIILALVLVAVLGYIGYRYTKDSKRTYIELKDSSVTPAASGTCNGTTLDSKLSKDIKSTTTCGYLCDESKGCAGYQWDTGCTLYSSIKNATASAGSQCFEPSS